MRKIISLCLLVTTLVLLCSCSVSTKEDQDYKFEPNLSIVEGTLITRMYYGQPGYGEDPENDAKEYPYLLQLDKPINVKAQEGDIMNSDKFDVKEIQVVPLGEEDLKSVNKYLDKRIKIEGTLFSALTGHHHTEVLIEVKRILE